MTRHEPDNGIPRQTVSCRTGRLESCAIESRVSAVDIGSVLDERPDLVDLVVSGMPYGSPGTGSASEREAYGVPSSAAAERPNSVPAVPLPVVRNRVEAPVQSHERARFRSRITARSLGVSGAAEPPAAGTDPRSPEPETAGPTRPGAGTMC
ncbi:MAG: DUF411 domain-containing protein [Caenispirillum sp.]|nr:DUF411 domain-containing protein [Caenispirillum sp.]